MWPGDTGAAENLIVQMGLDTGPIVVDRVGEDKDVEYTALGEVTRCANLLQQFAAPGAILLSEATRRAVEGFVDTEPVAIETPRGAVTAHRVTRLVGAPSVFGIRRGASFRRSWAAARELTVLEDLAAQALGATDRWSPSSASRAWASLAWCTSWHRRGLRSGAALLEGRSVSYGQLDPPASA